MASDRATGGGSSPTSYRPEGGAIAIPFPPDAHALYDRRGHLEVGPALGVARLTWVVLQDHARTLRIPRGVFYPFRNEAGGRVCDTVEWVGRRCRLERRVGTIRRILRRLQTQLLAAALARPPHLVRRFHPAFTASGVLARGGLTWGGGEGAAPHGSGSPARRCERPRRGTPAAARDRAGQSPTGWRRLPVNGLPPSSSRRPMSELGPSTTATGWRTRPRTTTRRAVRV
jgi:hypothetical protein